MEYDFGFLKKLNKKMIGLCAVIFILASFFAFEWKVNVSDAYVPNQIDDNTYLLKVKTGTTAGTDKVDCFVIDYESDGTYYRAYVNPKAGDFDESATLAASLASSSGSEVTTRQSIVQNYLDYTTSSWSSTSTTGSTSTVSSSSTYLESNSEDEYFFETVGEVDEIVSVSVVMNAEKGTQASWTYDYVTVSKVESLSGLSMYGFVSEDYYYDTESVELFHTTSSDSSITVSTSGSKMVALSGTSDSTSTASSDADSESKYMFKVSFEDEYEAGLETYTINERTSIEEFTPAEFLVLDIVYRDSDNNRQQIRMPVLTSALGYLIEQNGDDIAAADVIDMVSQGGSLAFEGNLPDMSKITAANIYYVKDASTLSSLTGLVDADDGTAHSNQYSVLSENSDTVKIASIEIYEGENTVSEKLINDNAQIQVSSASNTPIYSWYSAESGTLELGPGSSSSITLSDTQAEITEDDNWYVLQIVTASNISTAGTTADVRVKLEYTTTSSTSSSVTIDLREASKLYYGYWPETGALSGGEEYSYYDNGMGVGGTLYCLVQIDDAKKFTGMTIEKDGDGDDWLGSSITLYQAVNAEGGVGAIKSEWIDGEEHDTIPSDINVYRYRSINGLDVSLTDDDALGTDHRIFKIAPESSSDDGETAYGIYANDNSGTSIDFSSEEVTVVENDSVNIFEHYYSIDYETVTGNLGLTTSAYDYDIAVKVGTATDEESSAQDDAGSDNFFYFQLVFDSGESAYVQANQQLYSDGFRPGETEHFSITVNRDYGDVKQINIIPETDPDKGDPYDKLKIDTISAIKQGSSGLSTTYVVSNVGWIGIDYVDGEAPSDIDEDDLLKSYEIEETTTSATLMFNLTTDVYETNDDGSYNQFIGSAYASIHYTDSDGNSQTDNIDIVDAMYEFDGLSETNASYDSNNHLISDPDLMFRSGSVDRFLWNVSDIKKIKSMEIQATNQSGEEVTWCIKSVSVSLLTSGSLSTDRAVNAYGEYIIKDAETTKITDSTGTYTVSFGTVASLVTPINITFNETDGDIITPEDSSSTPYIIDVDTTSENDTFNLYAYVSPDSSIDADCTVTGSVTYEDVEGNVRKSSIQLDVMHETTSSGTKQYIYYYKGLTATEFSALKKTGFSVSGMSSDAELLISYVNVDQVRDKVIVGSYKCTFGDEPGNIADSETEEVCTTTIENTLIQGDKQTVTMQFGADMDEVDELVAANYDLAVQIDYTATVGTETDSYTTEPIYLTDVGIDYVKPGQVVSFDMYTQNIDAITGVTVSTTSFLKVDVDKMSIGTYSIKNSSSSSGTDTEDDSDTSSTTSTYDCTGWYSFDIDTVVTNESVDFEPTCTERDSEKTISPVTISISTLESYEGVSNTGIDSSKSAYMNFIYNSGDEVDELEIPDLNDYLTSGDFTAGKTATAVLLLEGIQYDKLKSITLCPADDDSSTSLIWGVEKLNVNYGDGQSSSDESTYSLNRLFTESDVDGTNTIYVESVTLSASLYKSTSTDEYVQDSSAFSTATQASPGKANIDCEDDSILLGFDVTVDNTDTGYTVTADEGGRGTFEIVSQSGGSTVVRISGTAGTSVTRTVKIASTDNPECYITYDITINFLESSSSSSTSTTLADDSGDLDTE